jgi:hypothetical protein
VTSDKIATQINGKEGCLNCKREEYIRRASLSVGAVVEAAAVVAWAS